MTKASDLRAMFGTVSQKSPLYMHTESRRNMPIPGLNSAKLKFKSQICGHCNSARTQPHDRAWQALSGHLLGRVPLIRRGQTVKLTPVFPGTVRASMLDVHLYFLKLFGCLIVEHSIPLDIAKFAKAILDGQPHPQVHLGFSVNDELPVRASGMTEVSAVQLGGVTRFATWQYLLGRLSVHVMFAAEGEKRMGLIDSWHPDTASKLLRIQRH